MAVIIFEDGKIFNGACVGAKGAVTGDFSYFFEPQAVESVLNNPASIGFITAFGYPVLSAIENPQESVYASGAVFLDIIGNKDVIDGYLAKNGVVGICAADARGIIRYIKNRGAMRAMISSENVGKFCENEPLVRKLPTVQEQKTEGKRVALVDFGLTNTLKDTILSFGFDLRVFLPQTPFEEILRCEPLGVIYAGECDYELENTIRTINALKTLPSVAIGKGALAAGIAFGFSVSKLFCGHFGATAVADIARGIIFSSNQFHTHTLLANGSSEGKIAFVNVSDNSVEGFETRDKRFAAVMFEPERGGVIWDRFIMYLR